MVQLKDIQLLDNGARFLNVDLHIHSYGGSQDVIDPTMTPEAIVDSAVRQGLRIIAITDHNSNVNVQRVIDHTQEIYAGQILVLPGVEVTTAHGHLLAYFAPDRIDDLTRFLSRLDLVGDGCQQHPDHQIDVRHDRRGREAWWNLRCSSH